MLALLGAFLFVGHPAFTFPAASPYIHLITPPFCLLFSAPALITCGVPDSLQPSLYVLFSLCFYDW
jgi:hypothetical protein